MGTSNKYGGTPSNSPLVPSWVGDLGDLPQAPDSQDPPKAEEAEQPPKDEEENEPKKNEPTPEPPPERFKNARTDFTAFVKSGGSDHGRLGRALGSYVRNGTGGARGAATRMTPSRKTAARVGTFIRDVQQVGPKDALQRIDCGQLVGKPAGEALHRLVDAFCPAGGPVDEAIARQAFMETVAVWSARDLPAIDQLPLEQWQELLLDFVTHSIELKIFEDIGAKGIEIPVNPSQALNIQTELHGVIEGCVRNAFGDSAGKFQNLSDTEISSVMTSVYERAWNFIEAVGGES